MSAIISLLAVLVLIGIAWIGISGADLRLLFGVVIPYAGVLIFFLGLIAKVLQWARSPVPFRIPTTCGQEKSFPWIKQNYIDNPSNKLGVVIRMALEVLTFRSLFRNTKLNYQPGLKTVYASEKWLWLFALIFHYAFLMVLIRHLRFFSTSEPVMFVLGILESLDGFMEVTLPALMLSGVMLLVAAFYLFMRRMLNSQVRYISMAADYFPLFLIMGIAATGILMRYFEWFRVDIVSIKTLTMSLVAFSPDTAILGKIGPMFFIHLS